MDRPSMCVLYVYTKGQIWTLGSLPWFAHSYPTYPGSSASNICFFAHDIVVAEESIEEINSKLEL